MKYYRFLTGWGLANPGCGQWMMPWCVCVCWGKGGHADMEQGALPVALGGSVCLSLGRGCEG